MSDFTMFPKMAILTNIDVHVCVNFFYNDLEVCDLY